MPDSPSKKKLRVCHVCKINLSNRGGAGETSSPDKRESKLEVGKPEDVKKMISVKFD